MGKFFCLSLLICLFLQCPTASFCWKSLNFLDLGSNLLEGPLPSSLCNLQNLQYLLLSNNKLNGTIPSCFGNMSMQLSALDLRKNSFHGMIPTNFPEGNGLKNLGLNGNQLEGSLPKSLLNCRKLEILDLGNNNISDTFPMWLETLPELSVLILKSNQLRGPIGASSKTNSSFQKLRILDISYNKFSGILPAEMINNFESMKKNGSSSSEARYMGDGSYYSDSVTLVMKGLEIELKRILTILTTIDLSENYFEGSIPESIGDLNSLKVLNFSHNQFNGSIPSTVGDLSELESLDLSWNKLEGRIPAELANLHYLSDLDVSNNRLFGRIPGGGQFNTFINESSFSGNAGLCGFPLKRCGKSPDEGSQSAERQMNQHETDYLDLMSGFTWKSVILGFGFGMILGVLMGIQTFYTQKPKWFYAIVDDVCRLSKRSRKEGRKYRKIRS